MRPLALSSLKLSHTSILSLQAASRTQPGSAQSMSALQLSSLPLLQISVVHIEQAGSVVQVGSAQSIFPSQLSSFLLVQFSAEPGTQRHAAQVEHCGSKQSDR